VSKVYLAGAIAGLTEGEAKDWRTYVSDKLASHGIIGVSPLRCEPAIGGRYDLNYDDPLFGQARTIRAKNMFDVRNTDIAIAYLPKPAEGKRQSYGTMWEVGAVMALGKPVIVVSDDPNVKNHPLFGGTADWNLDTLDQAIEVCIGILKVYTFNKVIETAYAAEEADDD
jgi:nucleoside 2-deoxyribosyltransferase